MKIAWTSGRSTRSYLTGIWPGTKTPTIGSRLQRPVQPVWCRMMSSAARGGDVLAELVEHLVAAGGVFAGGRADLDADAVARRPLAERFLGLLDQHFKLLKNVHFLRRGLKPRQDCQWMLEFG